MLNSAKNVIGQAFRTVTGRPSAASEAARKAAATRAADARKRIASAKKAAVTRAAKADARSATAKRAARTRKQRDVRVETMVEAMDSDLRPGRRRPRRGQGAPVGERVAPRAVARVTTRPTAIQTRKPS